MITSPSKEEKIKIVFKNQTLCSHHYQIQTGLWDARRSTLASKEEYLRMLPDNTSLNTDNVYFYQVILFHVEPVT